MNIGAMKTFTLTFHSIVLALLACATSLAQSNTTAAVAPSFAASQTIPSNGTLHVTPIHTTHPEAFSGVSGPGHPVVGNGYGGYRTRRDDVSRKGSRQTGLA